MKKFTWKRWMTLLSIALVVITVSGLVIGYYAASASVSSVTLGHDNIFGANSTDSTTIKSYWGTSSSTCTGIGLKGNTDAYRLQAIFKGTTDPYIGMTTKKDTLNYAPASNDIIQVVIMYESIGDYGDATLEAPAFRFANSSHADYTTSGWNGTFVGSDYSSSDWVVLSAKIPDTVINSGLEIDCVRIDPLNFKADTEPSGGISLTVRIASIYLGPPESAPYQEGITVNFYNPVKDQNQATSGTFLNSVTVAYNSTIQNAIDKYINTYGEPTYGTNYDAAVAGSIDTNTDAAGTAFDYIGWRANNTSNQALIGGNLVTATSRMTTTNNLVACYNGYVRMRFYTKDKATLLETIYVKHGAHVNSVLSALPTVSTITSGGTRYYPNGSWTRYRQIQADTSSLSATVVLGTNSGDNVTANVINDGYVDFTAQYKTQYRVRFYNGSTQVSGNKWVTTGNCLNDDQMSAITDPTPEDGYDFVGWSQGSADGTFVADPTSVTVTAPVDYYARFLSQEITASQETKPGFYLKKTVEQLEKSEDNYNYQMVIEFYQYGEPLDGPITFIENLDGNFTPLGLTDAHGYEKYALSVYRANYEGNGTFGEVKRITTGGVEPSQENEFFANGNRIQGGNEYYYLWDMGGDTDVWKKVIKGTKDVDYRYATLRFYDDQYTTNGLTTKTPTKTGKAVREATYVREDGTGGKGCKYIVVIQFYADLNTTMGGNNFVISKSGLTNDEGETLSGITFYTDNSTYSSAGVCTSRSLTKADTIEFYNTGDTYKTEDSDNNTWNVNMPIQYDLVPHDYYMDLFDRTFTDSEGTERTAIGLLTAAGYSDYKTANQNVYGQMFTHGNSPVYADNKAILPNTDTNGIRNQRVNIYYTVTLEDGTVVYKTYCDPSWSSFQTYDKSSWRQSDFTKDHTVTITANVVPLTGTKDSFGSNPDHTTWEHSITSYFFAPRFIVTDFGSVVCTTTLQNELPGTSFTYTPSYCLYDSENPTKTLGISYISASSGSADSYPSTVTTTGNISKYPEGGGYLWYEKSSETLYAAYDFTGDAQYKNNKNTLTRAQENNVYLDDYHCFSYTTTVIHALKYSGAEEITRNVYIIPASTILYDQSVMTFLGNSLEDTTSAWSAVDGETRNGLPRTGSDSGNNGGISDGSKVYGFGEHGDFTRVDESTYGAGAKDFMCDSMYCTPSVTITTDSDGNTSYDRTNCNNWGSFTFSGTGFDILSRTAPDTGVLVAQVYNESGTLVKTFFADTYLATATYQQAPVIRCYDLDYGTYTVQFRGYYHEAFDHTYEKWTVKGTDTRESLVRELLGLSEDDALECVFSESGYGNATRSQTANSDGTYTCSYKVYVDGVRIYNPLGDNITSSSTGKAQQIAYYAYGAANELNPEYSNLNDLLIDQSTVDAWETEQTDSWKTEGVTGALYIAADSDADLTTTGIFIGESGTFNLNSNNILCDASGTKISTDVCTTCTSNKNVKYNTEYDPVIGRERWYLTCSGCGERFSRDQIEQLEVLYYNSTYDAIGPEKEIHLAKDDGIAFNVDSSATVHISLNSADAKSVTAQIYNGSNWVTLRTTSSPTEMFFDVTDYVHNGYVIIKNTGSGILAIGSIKTIGASKGISVDYSLMALATSLLSETPVIDSGLELKHSLNLASDISVNFIIEKEKLADFDSFYLECELPVYEGNERVGSEFVSVDPVENGDYYYFTLEGLTAVQMNDVVTASLYLTKGEYSYTSTADSYSIAQYAYAQLEKEAASDSLKALCADLLRYGAAAQTYKGYRTDALVSAEMTDDQLAYLSDLDAVTFGYNNTTLSDVENPSITWVGKTLNLESKVAIKFIMDTTNYSGSFADLSLHVTYTDYSGAEQTAVITKLEAYNADKNWYAFNFDGLLAAELRTVVSVAVYEGDTQVSPTLQYSADTYGNNKSGTLLDLCKALFAYSDTALAFFAN